MIITEYRLTITQHCFRKVKKTGPRLSLRGCDTRNASLATTLLASGNLSLRDARDAAFLP